MSDELIDQYVDRAKVSDDTKFLEAELKRVLEIFNQIKGSKITLQGSKSLKDVSAAAELGIKANARLAESVKAVNAVITQRFATEAKLVTITTDYNKATVANRLEIQKQNTELKAQAQYNSANTGSIEKAMAAVKQLTIERNKLNLFTADGQKRQAELNAQIDKYNNFIKKSNDEAGKQRLNVGNYSGAISVLRTSLDEVTKKIDQNTKSGKANKEVMDALKKEQGLLNQILNSQAAGFANGTQEIRANQKALLQMTQAGLQGTEAFKQLALATGKLKDDVADLTQRTKVLGSDTFVFDGLIQSAQTLAGAYGVAQGASALFGEENEDLQKTFVKLQAIMTVIQGLQAVATGLQKESAAMLLLQNARTKILLGVEVLRNFVLRGTVTATAQNTIATNANTGALLGTTTATRVATGAMVGFRAALIATGIGAILILLASAAAAMSSMAKETKGATLSLEDFNNQVDRLQTGLSAEIEAIKFNSERRIEYAKQAGASESELNKLRNQEDKFITESFEKFIDRQIAKAKQFGEQYGITITGTVKDAEDARRIIEKLQDVKASPDFKEANEDQKAAVDATLDALKTVQDNVSEINKLSRDNELRNLQAQTKSAEEARANSKKFAEQRKKELEDNLRKTLEAERKKNGAIKALNIENANETIRINQGIADNDNSTLKQQILSLDEISVQKKKLAGIEFASEIESEFNIEKGKRVEIKKSQDEILLAITRFNNKINAVNDELLKSQQEAQKANTEKILAEYERLRVEKLKKLEDDTDSFRAADEKQYNDAVIALNARFESGKISQEKYNKEREKLDIDYQLKSLQREIDYQKTLIQISDLSTDKKEGALRKLSDLEKKLSDANKNNHIKNEDEKRSRTLKTLGTIQEVSTQVFSFIDGLLNANSITQKNKLKEQTDEQEKKAARDIEIVNASTASEQDKAAKIIVINARLSAQKDLAAQKERKINEQQAKFAKAVAIFNIILSTTQAVIKAFTEGDPYTKIARAIAAGAAGAAQLIVAIATPIPKYKYGKNLDDYDGPGLVNDGPKQEVIQREDGSIEFPKGRNVLTYVGRNDIIHPDKDAWLSAILKAAHRDANAGMRMAPVKGKNELEVAMEKQTKSIVSAIQSKRELHLGAGDKGMIALWKWGSQQTRYTEENCNW